MAAEMKAPSIVMPFFLPTIKPYGSESCYNCDPNEGEAFLDHARQYRKFSPDELSWAIQNGLDVKCIEAYLTA
ncbi:hypothetical protein N7G274_009025 [Stereocaulon virgatum]|uniref:Uncharacterized protein n=1 Tax=Stereocaulon virgatum TaxID=373712 RepID=A0ABR4A0R7_9LECA